MDNDATLGKTSLWTAIIGIVVPVSLLTLIAVFLGGANSALERTCLGLFVILEAIAIGCGIAARRTSTGKAGVVIAGILLLLILSILFVHLHVH